MKRAVIQDQRPINAHSRNGAGIELPPADVANAISACAAKLAEKLRQEREREYHETAANEIAAWRLLDAAIEPFVRRTWPHSKQLSKAWFEYGLARDAMLNCEAMYCGVGIRRRDELLVGAESAVMAHRAQRATGSNVGSVRAEQQRRKHGGTIEDLRAQVTEKMARYGKTEAHPLRHACKEATRKDATERRKNGKIPFSENAVYNHFRKFPPLLD